MNSQLDIQWDEFLEKSTDDRFEEFHANNPHVLDTIVHRARLLKCRGHSRGGISMLFEMMRWDHLMGTDSDDPFKLSNNYKPYYARLALRVAPDLAGFFVLRPAAADG